jgi:hypothetical protein
MVDVVPHKRCDFGSAFRKLDALVHEPAVILVGQQAQSQGLAHKQCMSVFVSSDARVQVSKAVAVEPDILDEGAGEIFEEYPLV